MIRTYLTLLLLIIWYPVWGQHVIPVPTQAQLSWQDAELAAILSYVRNAWGNQQGGLISRADVAAARAAGN